MSIKYSTSSEVLKKAKEIYKDRYHTFGEIDINKRLSSTGNKGNLGQIIEEGWFGIDVNSRHEKDFPDANLELKVIPYIEKEDGSKSGKERLVVSMINYEEEASITTFEESSFWKKADQILIMTYEHDYEKPKSDYYVNNAKIYRIPSDDLTIIKNDWQIIHDLIVAGKAHELSESLTNYLGACTKGANSSILVNQPNSNIKAKPRAYSLKGSYITYLIRNSLFNDNENNFETHEEDGYYPYSIEDKAQNIFRKYYGKTISELKELVNYSKNSKQINRVLIDKIIQQEYPSLNNELEKSNTIIKTVAIDNVNKISIKESMSFPTFKFADVIENSWEDSSQREFFEDLRILFIIFEKDQYNQELTFLKTTFFYTLSEDDLKSIKAVYDKTRLILTSSDVLIKSINSKVIKNKLPKMKDNPVAHVRPHARFADYTENGKYSDYIPSSNQWMTKQCFWLNSKFITKIISNMI